MSGESDLGQIKPPAEVPPEQPDRKTEEEARAFKERALTPTDRMEASHHSHIITLNHHITHHKDECERCRSEIATLRGTLDEEKSRSQNLGNECVKLRELSWVVGWLTVLSNGMVVLGGALIGIAGCWPGLGDVAKSAFGAGGVTMALCGVILTILSYAAGKRARHPEPRSDNGGYS